MSAIFNQAGQYLRAWVVFSGQADRPWLKVLRPGFRHCFVVLNDGRNWLSLDPMLNHIDLRVHTHVPPEFDLPGWLRARGHKVVAAPVDHTRKKPMPLALFTCVEAVKRVLGLHSVLIQTPWQLYRYLSKLQQLPSTVIPANAGIHSSARAGSEMDPGQLVSPAASKMPGEPASGMTGAGFITKGEKIWAV